MKESLLASLERPEIETHGCFQPEDGPCFYFSSTRALGDASDRRVRSFMAHVEGGDGLVGLIGLEFGVSRTVLSTRQAQRIGDLEEFLRTAGLARLRAMIERDPTTQRNEQYILTTNSADWEFERPSLALAIAEYASLKRRILFVLAGLQAQGFKRVERARALDHLAADPKLIDRAIGDLVSFGLIESHDSGGGWRLSPKGREQAEQLALTESPKRSGKAERQYDLFVSYASEDHALASALKSALESAGLRVWLDKSEITLGDSLIAKLNAGLSVSRYGLVILSPSYLSKPWPKSEFEALQHKAISSERKVILPILHRLSHAQLSQMMPLMGPIITAEFKDNLDEIVDSIRKAIL